MTLRRATGIFCSIGATFSACIYVATLLGANPFSGLVWPFFFGTALTFVTSAMAEQTLKPQYKVDRVLQLQKLRPFFTDADYKLVWYAFYAALVGIVCGIPQVTIAADPGRVVLQVFAAGWFSAFAIDSLIFLKAKPPESAIAHSEA